MRGWGLLTSVMLVAALACGAYAATPGFVEDFNGGDTAGWGGSVTSIDWHASGGVGGAADGYISIYNEFESHLGTRNADADYTGDLTADGVTGVSFWLSELGTDDNLEIHVGVGESFNNFWVSVAGFTPPINGWSQFSVDFSDSGDWVQVIDGGGGGTFEDALASSDRLLFRYDTPPIDNPAPVADGDFGLDGITLLPEPGTLGCLIIGAAGLLRRRRSQ